MAKKVSAPKVIKPKPIPKAETKSADRSSDRLDREPPTAQSPKTETKVEKKSGQFGPATTFPRDVGAGKAAEARKKSFDGSNPFSDLMDLLRGKKNGGTIKKSSVVRFDELMVLLSVVKQRDGWSNVLNQQHSVFQVLGKKRIYQWASKRSR
jgi:hypothetical protein